MKRSGLLYPGSITDLAGITVGCYTDAEGGTGCTCVLLDRAMTAGVDVRGGGSGTMVTDLLNPVLRGECLADAIVLSGGSAFGLGTVHGAMRYLEERGRGHLVPPSVRVPIVPGAIIFDLLQGDPKKRRPDPECGYSACASASSSAPPQGRFGAGTGATVGKVLGMAHCERGGQGTASITLPGGVVVAALVVVNSVGDVHDGEEIVSGVVDERGVHADTLRLLLEGARCDGPADDGARDNIANTTIGVVATNAKLTSAMATRMAMTAHDGLAMAIRPVHTLSDGDTMFAVATGDAALEGTLSSAMLPILTAAAEVTRRAIVNAVVASKYQ